MGRARRRLGARSALALAAAALAVAAAAAVAVLAGERGRQALLHAAARTAGYTVEAHSLRISPGLSVRTENLSVAVAGEPPFFRAERLLVDASLWSLLHGRARSIEARGFELEASRLPAGGAGTGSPRAPFDELRLARGVLRDMLGTGAGGSNVRIRRVVLARSTGGEAMAIHGAVRIPGRKAHVRWRGSADPSGDRLAVSGRGIIRDLRGLLTELGAEAVAAHAGPARLTLRVQGELDGALRSRLRAAVASPSLAAPATFAARLKLDGAREHAAVRMRARAAHVEPLRVRGSIDVSQTPWRLALRPAWHDAAPAALARALRDPPQWLPHSGELDLHGRIDGPSDDPRVDFRMEASRIGLRVGAFDSRADVRAALRYEDGLVRSVEPHLQADKIEIRGGTTNATAERMTARAELRLGDRLEGMLNDVAITSAAVQDETRELQAAAIELTGNLSVAVPSAGPATMQASLRAGAGEALYERAYLSFGDFPVEISTSITTGANGVRFEQSTLDVSKLGRIEGAASLDSGFRLARVEAAVSVPSMSIAFEKLIGETFADVLPFLGRTKVGGAMHATVDYRKTADGSRTSGRIDVRDGSLAVSEPVVKLDHYDLDVPFDLGTGSPQGTVATGSLRSGALELAGMAVSPIDLPLVARSNEIEVTKPLTISFAGGTLRAENLRAFDLAGAAPGAEVRLAASAMSLEELGKTLGWPALRGTLAGDLGSVRLSDTRIAASGAVALDVFGGKVVLSDIAVEEVYSPVPSLRLDVEATGINLRQATESLGVGYVAGVGRARIDDLEFAAGQPMRFDAEFENIPSRGVPQRVSVAAIQQLTILGGGGPDALTRRVLGLFDEYRYAKMGFRCSLRNDRFILHGIEERDGKDFLVVGTLFPPTVNVISHNQVIAFGEMVERLQRINAVGDESPDVKTNP